MRRDETSALIEAWLDGRLEGREALVFQERLAGDPDLAAELELAERVQASLRRSFVPPARPGAAASTGPLLQARRVRGGAPVRARSASKGGALRRAAACLAVAAAVVLVLRWNGGDEARTPSPDRAAKEAAWRVGPVGPLETADLDGLAPRVSAPDLERLYAEAVAGSDGHSMTCGPEDDLGATLAASYGEKVALRPEANQMLSGPFASSRWPTATILRGPGANPAVLVAEREATHRCCVLFELSPESGLNLFTWQLGDLVLTEITPLEEPLLLGYFE